MINIIKKIIVKLKLINKNIKIDFYSNVSLKSINFISKNIASKEYPIKITKSSIGNLKMKEGCKITNSICSGNIELGRFVSINGPGTRISSRLEGIKIGDFSSIASNVVIQEDYHDYNRVSSYFFNQNIFKEDIKSDIFTKGKIIIEEDVWIGSNSTILSGVKVGRGAIIGAGSVVTKDVPKYAIVAGNPSKIIKYRFDDATINYLETSKWWEWDLNEIKNNKKFFNNKLN